MKRNHIVLLFVATIIGCVFTCSNIFANYIPRLYLTGSGGYDSWFAQGQADLLMPIFTRYDRVLFLYGQGRYGHQNQDWGDNSWFGGLGIGYRQDIDNNFIVGGYLLGDYNKTILGHDVTSVSPGIEIIGHDWEWRTNGYIPVGTKCWHKTYWADQVGNYDYVRLQGHTRYDAKFIYYEETGPGLDSELGRTLFKINNITFKGYLNGFYYHMQHNSDVIGAGARITADPTSYLKVSVADSYDGHNRNVIMASARVSLYDLFSHKQNDANDLTPKLFAPIERNFGTIGSGSNLRETGGPNDHLAKPVVDVWHGNPAPGPKPQPGPRPKPGPKPKPVPPSPYVENDNAWYFGNITADVADKRRQGDAGTAENPYSAADFNQATLEHIRQYNRTNGYNHADIYFSPGSYNIAGGVAKLYNDFSLYGMEGNYINPAQGDARPILQGGLALANNNNLNNLKVSYDGQQDAAVTMDNSSNDILYNVDILDKNNSAAAMKLSNAHNIVVEDSSITKNNSSGNASAVLMAGQSDLTVNNSHITVDGTNSTGIKMASSNTLTMNDSVIKATANNSNSFGVTGVGTNDQVTLNQANIQATSSGSGSGFGLLLGAAEYNSGTDAAVSNNALEVNDSSITGKGENGYGVVVGYGAANSTDIQGDVANNKITIKGDSNIVGQGVATTKDYTGNGFGLLVGYGLLYYDSYLDSHIDVINNTVDIGGQDSTHEVNISGNGQGNDAVTGGDGFGVVVGYGQDVATHVPSNIAANKVSINTAKITGTGTEKYGANGGGYDSINGLGFGVAIGTGTLSIDTGQSLNIGSTTVGQGNSITINNSTISSSSQSDIGRDDDFTNAGAAVLIGVGDYIDPGAVNSVVHLNNNHITVGNGSNINITTHGQGISGAMGVAIGDLTKSVDGINNFISVNASKITAEADSPDEYHPVQDYGVYIFQDSRYGNNISASTKNNIFKDANNMSIQGYAITDSKPAGKGISIDWPFTPGK